MDGAERIDSDAAVSGRKVTCLERSACGVDCRRCHRPDCRSGGRTQQIPDRRLATIESAERQIRSIHRDTPDEHGLQPLVGVIRAFS
jgi:hypothetical protein